MAVARRSASRWRVLGPSPAAAARLKPPDTPPSRCSKPLSQHPATALFAGGGGGCSFPPRSPPRRLDGTRTPGAWRIGATARHIPMPGPPLPARDAYVRSGPHARARAHAVCSRLRRRLLALAEATPRRGGVVWWSRVSGWRSTRRWRVLRPWHSDTARAKALASPRSRYVTAALAASLQAVTAQRGDALLCPPYRATRRSGGTRQFCRFALGVRAYA